MSGLWIGEAVPNPSWASEVPVNPIKWSLALVPEAGLEISAFGGGYFDDSGDVPGQPVRILPYLSLPANSRGRPASAERLKAFVSQFLRVAGQDITSK